MTSGPTRKATEDFFREHDYFGHQDKDVIFFEQGTLPALTFKGEILLETKSTVKYFEVVFVDALFFFINHPTLANIGA